MTCPICNRTMHSIGLDDPGRRTWWCQFCGTLKEQCGEVVKITMPGSLRQIIGTAGLRSGQVNQSQGATVKVEYQVTQRDHELPMIEPHVYGPDGRRII